MEYKKAKEKLFKQKKELMDKYDEFYFDCMMLGESFFDTYNYIVNSGTPLEMVDYNASLLYDDDIDKLERLLTVMMYVEHPNDIDILAKLKDDLDSNIEKALKKAK